MQFARSQCWNSIAGRNPAGASNFSVQLIEPEWGEGKDGVVTSVIWYSPNLTCFIAQSEFNQVDIYAAAIYIEQVQDGDFDQLEL